MTQDNFTLTFQQLMEQTKEYWRRYKAIIKEIENENEEYLELQKTVDAMKDSMDMLSLGVQYLMLDVEATKRERDTLRTILEDKE